MAKTEETKIQIPEVAPELIKRPSENAIDYPIGNGKRRLEICIGALNYKDNYEDDNEPYKPIDLTWKDNKITKAPYTLERIGNKIIVLDKKSGKTGTIELTDIGATKLSAAAIGGIKSSEVVKDVDVEIIPAPDSIRFQTVIKDETALAELKYKVSGDIPIKYSAVDADGDAVPLITSLSKGVLTESVDAKSFTSLDEKKTAIKYPIKIDPTLTIQGSGEDTDIAEGAKTSNYGSQTYMRLDAYSGDARRGLVKMSLSELPAGAVISTAVFSIYYYYKSIGDPNGEACTLYKLRRSDWVEAQATWNIYKTSNNWGTAGAGNTSTDIDTSITAATTFPASYGWLDFDAKSIVEDAVANSLDFNVRISTAASGDYPRVYSKEYNTDTTRRPKLVIDYTEGKKAKIIIF